jgi:hypothetical protein
MRVTQQGLDHQQVHAFVQQVRSECMAQRVRVHRFGNTGAARGLLARTEYARPVNGTTRKSAWEEPVGRPLPTPVSGEHFAQRFGQHHLPVLVAFSAAYPDDAPLAVQIGNLQARHFRYAEPCRIYGRQNRPVLEVPRRF